uniref:Uncharacterized protein n=1 Tax=Rhizophora mucronata TaxID=61149 RepID=A0A2P2N0R8_RHIMU
MVIIFFFGSETKGSRLWAHAKWKMENWTGLWRSVKWGTAD